MCSRLVNTILTQTHERWNVFKTREARCIDVRGPPPHTAKGG